MSWTDERVDLLKKLWLDGLSASQIANELGGVIRNAVIGKVHRLGLSGRAKTSSHAGGNRQKRQPRTSCPKPVQRQPQRSLLTAPLRLTAEAIVENAPEPELAAIRPDPLRLELIQLTERTCKWPLGDPALEDFHFCGHPSKESGPYCPYHSRLAYQAPPERRRDRRIEAVL